jgi:raffinose/stachyose/melibiose transport system permease protein
MSDMLNSGVAANIINPKKKSDKERKLFIFLMLLPAIFFLLAFLYYPIVETFRLSLMKSTGMSKPTFYGFNNYIYLFHNDEFRAGLLHVFQWAFFSVIVQIPLAFFIAYSVVYYKNRLTRKLRSVYYLANVLPTAIVSMLGLFMFSSATGVITTLAEKIGFQSIADIDWLGNPSLAFWTVFIVATWTYTGFPIIYLMARIEQIPNEIREAALLDGVTGWTYARYIVLPLCTYQIRILAILAIIGSLKLFDIVQMMTRGGGPGWATATLGTILYNQGFRNWKYGSAAAVGVIILLLSLVFTVAQFSLKIGSSDETN